MIDTTVKNDRRVATGELAASIAVPREHESFSSHPDKTRGARPIDWFCAALLIAFLAIGLFGRDPWKADEPYSVGMVLNFFRGHDLIVPRVAADPFVEKPPVMYWTGALSARLFAGVLPVFDGAQFGVLFWTLVAAVCVGRLAHRVSRARSRVSLVSFDWLAPALMFGSLGVIEHVHKLTADVPQMAGAALALAALVRLAHADGVASRDGLQLGTGAGIAFLSKGLLVPGVLALTCLGALALPAWRTRRYGVALAWAIAAALPWVVIWPVLFWHASPELFTQWFWVNNFGRFLGFAHLGAVRTSYLSDVTDLIVLVFPAGWLAVGSLIAALRAEGTRRYAAAHPDRVVLWLYVGLFVATLEVSQSIRDIYLMPIFPALGVLGATARLPRRFEKTSAALAIVTMSGLGLLVWIGWGLQVWGHGRLTAGSIGKWLPLDFPLALSPWSLLVALAVLALWIAAIVHRRTLGALMTAFAGLTFVWGTVYTLLLPWINDARSYREPFAQLQEALPQTAWSGAANACVASYQLGESERAMLDYFIDVRPVQIFDLNHTVPCRLLLVLDKSGHRVEPPAGWREVWQGGRDGDSNERFRLLNNPM